MEYSPAIKKKILPLVKMFMDFEGVKLSEVNNTEKDKYHIISLIYVIIKTKQSKNQPY